MMLHSYVMFSKIQVAHLSDRLPLSRALYTAVLCLEFSYKMMLYEYVQCLPCQEIVVSDFGTCEIKFVLVLKQYGMGTFGRVKGVASCVFNFDIRWTYLFSFMPRQFYPLFPLFISLDGSQNESEIDNYRQTHCGSLVPPVQSLASHSSGCFICLFMHTIALQSSCNGSLHEACTFSPYP
jgi:hypothetical protein